MLDILALLEDKAFWLYYACTTDESFEDVVTKVFGPGAIENGMCPQAFFHLPFDDDFELVITIRPRFGYNALLELWEPASDTAFKMGWWDEATFHPHVFRWVELLQLAQYWKNHLESDISPSAAFLLLARFIAIGDDEIDEFAAMQDEIRHHYEKLQLFTDAEISSLTDTLEAPEDEDDCRWTLDDKLGWVFGSYSIRSPLYADNTEWRFPFSQWSKLITKLPKPAMDS